MSARLQTQAKATPLLTPVQGSLLQRKCACGGSPGLSSECEECQKNHLQRRAVNSVEPIEVPPIVHEVLRSPGQPLDRDTRAFMEPRFGHDFSQVRVHADARAAEAAGVVHALAFTVGRHVVFAPGQYAPATQAGRQLLAHELTHILQQAMSAPDGARALPTGKPDSPSEREAQRFSEAVSQGIGVVPALRPSNADAQLQRQDDRGKGAATLTTSGAGKPPPAPLPPWSPAMLSASLARVNPFCFGESGSSLFSAKCGTYKACALPQGTFTFNVWFNVDVRGTPIPSGFMMPKVSVDMKFTTDNGKVTYEEHAKDDSPTYVAEGAPLNTSFGKKFDFSSAESGNLEVDFKATANWSGQTVTAHYTDTVRCEVINCV